MRTFLVTGGAGFIGSHIAEALVHGHDRVRVLDNLSTGHLSNLDSFRDKVEFIEGDLLDERIRSSVLSRASIASSTKQPWPPCREASRILWQPTLPV